MNKKSDIMKYCSNCGDLIIGKGFTVNDEMGMSGGIYHFCDMNCADEFQEDSI